MKKMKASLAAKIGAIILFLLFSAASLGGIVAIFYMADQGVYSQNGYSYYDSYACSSTTYNYAYDVYNHYLPVALTKEPTAEESFRLEQYETTYSKENTNFSFAVTDEEGKTILANDPVETYGAKEVYTFDDDSYDENGDPVENGESYTVTAYVKDPITVKDDYYGTYRLLTSLHSFRYAIIAVTIIAALIALLLFVFLLSAAGHRRNEEGISLNMFDKIPLDVLICVIILLAMVGIYPLDTFWYDFGTYGEIAYIGAVLVVCALVGLAFCMTLAARIKAGKWWQNTLIYRIGRAVGKGVNVFFANIPLLWKTIVAFGVYFFFNIIFFMAAINGSGFFGLLYFVFNIAVLFGLCFLVLQLNRLKKGGERIADGDFEMKIDTKNMVWEIKDYAETLNDIGRGMSRAVEERLKSERFKAELVTNVSHDIKTPLTSIINYVDLLKKEEIANETANEYIDVLDRQSAKLKKLTEDLVEASKASTGNIAIHPERVDVVEFLNQLLGEYTERFAVQQLKPVVSVAEEGAAIFADGRLMWRVFDNLLNNICKYALPNTRVYFDVGVSGKKVEITLKNISATPLNITADELMERFIRGDSARTTEGSGLGLSIAKSLTELQKGGFALYVDGDLFKVAITFDQIT